MDTPIITQLYKIDDIIIGGRNIFYILDPERSIGSLGFTMMYIYQ